jgi:hypothetical protein
VFLIRSDPAIGADFDERFIETGNCSNTSVSCLSPDNGKHVEEDSHPKQ